MTRDELIIEGLKTVDLYYNKYYYKYKLFMFMSKEDLEDMQQDCVVEMIGMIDNFDPGQNVLLSTYLYRRIEGFYIDYIRNKSKIKALEKDWAFHHIHEEVDKIFTLSEEQAEELLDKLNLSDEEIKEFHAEITESSVLTKEVYDSLAKIPSLRIYVILSYYIMDKSITEINAELGYSEKSNWVYQLKREGIKQIKIHLGEKI